MLVLLHAHGGLLRLGQYVHHQIQSIEKCYSTNLQANCLAIHEFGKDLEAQIGKVQFLVVLVFAAYASGLTMIVTNHPVGAEALLPVGASGRPANSNCLSNPWQPLVIALVTPGNCPSDPCNCPSNPW